MSFFAIAYHSAHQFHHCAHQLLRPARQLPLPRRPWTPSCATSESHFGEPLCRFGEPSVPRRSALCATCHSAVLPACGYPSLFGSQCRLVANCQQRADAVRDITCGVEVCGEEVADCAWSTHHLTASIQRHSCKTPATVEKYNLLIICTIEITSVADELQEAVLFAFSRTKVGFLSLLSQLLLVFGPVRGQN